MIPADVDLEQHVLAWAAEDGDARALLEELQRRDFYDFANRGLFTIMRQLYRAGDLVHGFAIRGGIECVHTWSGIAEADRAELAAIVESGTVPIYFPCRGRDAVARLRQLTKRRAILAAAERVLAGEELSDAVLEYLLREEADA